MDNNIVDAGADTVTRYIRSQVDNMDLEPRVKGLIVYLLDNSKALMDFSVAYARQKATGKVKPNELMKEFLKSRGRSIADFGITTANVEVANSVWAVFQLVLDVRSSAKYSAAGPFGVAMTVGFIINDASSFLCSFSPAQRAYYDLFLKRSSVRVPVAVTP